MPVRPVVLIVMDGFGMASPGPGNAVTLANTPNLDALFAGSPWTLANFMIEGGGVGDYTKAKALFYSDHRLFSRLLEKLTKAVAGFLQLQIDAGAEAVQIFDSLGGVLSDGEFGEIRLFTPEERRREAPICS